MQKTEKPMSCGIYLKGIADCLFKCVFYYLSVIFQSICHNCLPHYSLKKKDSTFSCQSSGPFGVDKISMLQFLSQHGFGVGSEISAHALRCHISILPHGYGIPKLAFLATSEQFL